MLLGVGRWDTVMFVLLDIYHETYNPEEAHLPGSNDLPVISVRLGSRNTVVETAPPPHAIKTNKRLEELHNSFEKPLSLLRRPCQRQTFGLLETAGLNY